MPSVQIAVSMSERVFARDLRQPVPNATSLLPQLCKSEVFGHGATAGCGRSTHWCQGGLGV